MLAHSNFHICSSELRYRSELEYNSRYLHAVKATILIAMDFSPLIDSSAAQPAPECDVFAQFRNLQECHSWMQALPSQEILKSKPLQRVHKAIAVLQRHHSRQQRKEVQQLLHAWDVVQKTQGQKRQIHEVKADLAAKVVEETCRLKKMRCSLEAPSAGGSASNASARLSAIQASLQRGSVES